MITFQLQLTLCFRPLTFSVDLFVFVFVLLCFCFFNRDCFGNNHRITVVIGQAYMIQRLQKKAIIIIVESIPFKLYFTAYTSTADGR